MAFLQMNRSEYQRKGFTLVELIVSLCISGVILTVLFSLILTSVKFTERSFTAKEKEMCEKALLDPLASRMERADNVVLVSSDEQGRASAALLFEKDKVTFVCASDISFEYNGVTYEAFCGGNEICFQSFSVEGEQTERTVLKNASERILFEGLKFYCVDEENGIFTVKLLMSTEGKAVLTEERYVCVFAM